MIGLPALRIRGLFLAVTTLAFAVALDSYVLNVNNFPSLVPSNVSRPLLFGRFDLEDQYTMYVLCLVVLAVWIAVAVGIRRSRTGRTLIATRDNERAAAAAGVVPTRVKLGGFLLAGTIAGVAGALHVQLLHSLEPRQLSGHRQHHGVLHGGHRRASARCRGRWPACCCSSTSRPSRPSATCA